MSEDELAQILSRFRQSREKPMLVAESSWRIAYKEDVGRLLTDLGVEA